eukprot:jgi/Undpi1/14167/HiC_scaffold_9.g03818.m1
MEDNATLAADTTMIVILGVVIVTSLCAISLSLCNSLKTHQNFNKYVVPGFLAKAPCSFPLETVCYTWFLTEKPLSKRTWCAKCTVAESLVAVTNMEISRTSNSTMTTGSTRAMTSNTNNMLSTIFTTTGPSEALAHKTRPPLRRTTIRS